MASYMHMNPTGINLQVGSVVGNILVWPIHGVQTRNQGERIAIGLDLADRPQTTLPDVRSPAFRTKMHASQCSQGLLKFI